MPSGDVTKPVDPNEIVKSQPRVESESVSANSCGNGEKGLSESPRAEVGQGSGNKSDSFNLGNTEISYHLEVQTQVDPSPNDNHLVDVNVQSASIGERLAKRMKKISVRKSHKLEVIKENMEVDLKVNNEGLDSGLMIGQKSALHVSDSSEDSEPRLRGCLDLPLPPLAWRFRPGAAARGWTGEAPAPPNDSDAMSIFMFCEPVH
ncbi:PAS/PAC sensor hybrid histidine kinase [Striga asiatica]|uniref:PAS/PAC sensor hybrid histidine kinase n=1 Tax=Striga asiatica TaxID=4170 RepID=A0A5A7P2S6_STRAF|nr:PAS/PAC sensor hybrid histidine kinase [Striga asiatica]